MKKGEEFQEAIFLPSLDLSRAEHFRHGVQTTAPAVMERDVEGPDRQNEEEDRTEGCESEQKRAKTVGSARRFSGEPRGCLFPIPSFPTSHKLTFALPPGQPLAQSDTLLAGIFDEKMIEYARLCNFKSCNFESSVPDVRQPTLRPHSMLPP